MKNIKSIILLFLLMIINIGCNNNLDSSLSSKETIEIGEYNKSPVVLSENTMEIYVGEYDIIEVASEYSYTWYIDDNEIVNIKHLENNKYEVIGLKEGQTVIHALSLNGKSADCTIKVLYEEDSK